MVKPFTMRGMGGGAARRIERAPQAHAVADVVRAAPSGRLSARGARDFDSRWKCRERAEGGV